MTLYPPYKICLTLYSTANYHIILIYPSKNGFHILLFFINLISGARLIHLVIYKIKKMILDYCFILFENRNSHN